MSKKTGKYYINSALEHQDRITTRNGHGDHYVCYGRDNNGNFTRIAIPVNLQGNGTECSIKKWFLRFGIVVTLVLGVIGYISIT